MKFFSISFLWGLFRWFYSGGGECGFSNFPTFGLKASFFFGLDPTSKVTGLVFFFFMGQTIGLYRNPPGHGIGFLQLDPNSERWHCLIFDSLLSILSRQLLRSQSLSLSLSQFGKNLSLYAFSQYTRIRWIYAHVGWCLNSKFKSTKPNFRVCRKSAGTFDNFASLALCLRLNLKFLAFDFVRCCDQGSGFGIRPWTTW